MTQLRACILRKNGHEVIKLNRRKAIREKCLNCSTWVTKEVAECTFDDCHLYPFRSGKGKQDGKARAKAIRNHCLWCMNGQQSEIWKCPSEDCSLWSYRKSTTDWSINVTSTPEKSHLDVSAEVKKENA